jgi:hypothetical protein
VRLRCPVLGPEAPQPAEHERGDDGPEQHPGSSAAPVHARPVQTEVADLDHVRRGDQVALVDDDLAGLERVLDGGDCGHGLRLEPAASGGAVGGVGHEQRRGDGLGELLLGRVSPSPVGRYWAAREACLAARSVSRISTCSPPLSALSAACSTTGQRDGSRVRRMVRLSDRERGQHGLQRGRPGLRGLGRLKASSIGLRSSCSSATWAAAIDRPFRGVVVDRRLTVGSGVLGQPWFRRVGNRGVARGRIADWATVPARSRGSRASGRWRRRRRATTIRTAATTSRTASRRPNGLRSFVRLPQHGSAPSRSGGAGGQQLRHQLADGLSVGAAARLRREPAHDLAHVARGRRAGLGDGLVDQRPQLRFRDSGWGMNSETTAMAASSLATRSSRPPARNVSTDSWRTLSSRVRTPSISSSEAVLAFLLGRWTAASTMRSASRRMASLDRIAAFNSSSSRSRRDTGVAPRGGLRDRSRSRTLRRRDGRASSAAGERPSCASLPCACASRSASRSARGDGPRQGCRSAGSSC